MTPGLQFCFIIKIGKKLLEKPSPVSRKAWQDVRSLCVSSFLHTNQVNLPMLSSFSPIAPVYIKAQIKQEHYNTQLSTHKYFGTCSYLQGTQGACRTALPMKVHSIHPQNFFWSSFFSQSTSVFLQQGKHGNWLNINLIPNSKTVKPQWGRKCLNSSDNWAQN